MKFLKGKLGYCIIVSVIVSIVLSLLFSANFLHSQSLKTSDIFYSEQKAFSDIVIVKIDDQSINEIGRWPWNREVFATAMQKLDDAKAIGIDVSFFEKAEGDDLLSQAISDKIILVAECNKFSNQSCESWLLPAFNATTASANIYSEDEIARAVPFKIDNMKSLSVMLSEAYLNQNLNLKSKIIINFAEPSSFESISFSDLLNSNISDAYSGKIVLIGATAKDLHDEKLTPLSSKPMPGVEIHANAVQTIITQKNLHYQSDLSVIITIILLSFIISAFLYFFRLVYAIIGTIILPVLYISIGLIKFENGVILNFLYPALSIILTFVAAIVLYYLIESKQRKWVSHLFGKYVSHSVANELIRQGENAVSLKGVRKEITVLFADVRGFTSMSEKLEPEQVVELLNKYHSKMTDVIFKYNGTLDKYVGDEIMATYNVPLDMKDHALNAVQTAIEMQIESKKLGKNMVYGIGINTGQAVVGNIGSERRLDYTVIGDSVNLGARLCSKAEGHQILISESTNELVKDKIKTKSIGEITVKGKEKPIKVYEVLY